MAITQVITTLPTAPDPSTMTRDQFSTAAAASVLAQKAMVPEINTWTSQVNAIVSGTAGDIASGINGATAKTTPVDADLLGITDSAASWVLKKLTWANLKTTLGNTFAVLSGSASQTFSVAAATAAAHAVRKDQTSLSGAFTAFLTSTLTDVTGDGTVATITGYTAIADRSSGLNTSSGIFTAPVTGLYRLTVQARIVGITTSDTENITIVTSNRSYISSSSYTARASTAISLGISCLADMTAGDTAYVTVAAGGGTKIADIQGGSPLTFFCGELV